MWLFCIDRCRAKYFGLFCQDRSVAFETGKQICHIVRAGYLFHSVGILLKQSVVIGFPLDTLVICIDLHG